MFVNQTRLKHVLPARAYYDPDQLAIEKERLMLPAWHLLDSTADMPNDGDFLTLEILDQPILVRNFSGEFHTFLNVCGHRHSMLTNEPKGHSERLKCQCHGWEYNKEGRTGKIPEAKCFAP